MVLDQGTEEKKQDAPKSASEQQRSEGLHLVSVQSQDSSLPWKKTAEFYSMDVHGCETKP